jgi:hypothetical protein
MSENRKVRPVSFSLDDPFEVRLNEHADKQKNFSKYVKRLIAWDMERGGPSMPANTPPTMAFMESDKNDMLGFI